MNLLHRLVCRSGLWRWTVERWMIPWALDGLDPGEDVLELGPGPGLTTDVLRGWVARLTAVEIDPRLASSLQARMKNTNVEVVEADATAMPFPDGSFSAVLSFTMLHHVPSVTLQDQLLAEAWRVLRPGGVFAGTDTARAFFCGWPTSAIRWSRWTRRPSAKGSGRPASRRSR